MTPADRRLAQVTEGAGAAVRGLHVLLVAYGDPELPAQALTALAAPTGSVTVVDNGRDPRVEEMAARHGAAYVLPESNLGFAAGVNLGLGRTAREDVLLLNPDARFAWEQGRSMQASFLDDPRLAAVAPMLVRPDGSQERPSWPLPSPGQVWRDALALERFGRSPHFLTGAVLMLRREALDELGGLDERYFLYAEEADWQLSALRAGWRIRLREDLSAVHLGGATSSDSAVRHRHFTESGRSFARKWYGPWGVASMAVGSRVAVLRRSAVARAGRRAPTSERT